MPFAKGNNANPGGAYNAKPMREAITIELATEVLVNAQKIKKLRLVARALVDRAIEGDVQAIKDVIDRMDGKAPITGTDPSGGHSFVIRLIHEGKPKGVK